MAVADENRGTIEQFWEELFRRDFEALASRFAEDGEYTDVATSADDVARGQAQVAARLRLALAPLAAITDERRSLLADDSTVITERVEHWEWPSGETMSLPVVSVHQLENGKIVRWWDYWDMSLLVGSAPQWWFEHVLQGWQTQP